jgi:hypothetical protein
MLRIFTIACLLWSSLSVGGALAQGPTPGELPFNLAYWGLSGRMTLEVTRPEFTHMRIYFIPAESFIKPTFTLVPGTEQRVGTQSLDIIFPFPQGGYYDLGYLVDPNVLPNDAHDIQIWYGQQELSYFKWGYLTWPPYPEPPLFLVPEPSGGCIGLVAMAGLSAFRRQWSCVDGRTSLAVCPPTPHRLQ